MTTNMATWGAERPQSGILAPLFRAMDAFSRARAKRRTAVALAELDDFTLVDIGLNPGDVRKSPRSVAEWVVHSHSGTARLIFIGR